MIRSPRSLLLALCGALLLAAVPAHAGPYADTLGRCLVRSTSDAERTTLVKWIVAVIALHPDVQSLAAASDEARLALDRDVAALMERLLTESCRNETQEAVKYEGAQTLQGSFRVLGQVAARQLFTDPQVSGGMTGFTKHLDRKKFDELLKDARPKGG